MSVPLGTHCNRGDFTDADLKIKYEGGDADKHFVEMRAFGNSKLGFERIISDGLIFLGEDRLPKRGERHTLAVPAHEPVIGSSEIPIFLTQNAGLLPFGWWLMQTGTVEAVSYFSRFVFTHLSGRNSEAKEAMNAMIAMREIEARERLATNEQWLAHEAGWRNDLIGLANRLALSAIRAVAPVGPLWTISS